MKSSEDNKVEIKKKKTNFRRGKKNGWNRL